MTVENCIIYEYCQQQIENHPSLRNCIIDLYTLAMDEIESGESYENEYSHLQTAVEDLIEESE